MIAQAEPRCGPLIVEICGIAGAGKTTLAQVIAQEIADRQIPFCRLVPAKEPYGGGRPSLIRRMAWVLFAIRNPSVTVKLAVALFPLLIRGLSLVDMRRRLRLGSVWFRRLLLYAESVRRMRAVPAAHFLERGLTSNLLSLAARLAKPEPEGLLRWAQSAGATPDLVVSVHTDLDIVHERRRARGDAPKPSRGDARHEAHTLRVILDSLDVAAAPHRIDVDGGENGAVERNAQLIVDEMVRTVRCASVSGRRL